MFVLSRRKGKGIWSWVCVSRTLLWTSSKHLHSITSLGMHFPEKCSTTSFSTFHSVSVSLCWLCPVQALTFWHFSICQYPLSLHSWKSDVKKASLGWDSFVLPSKNNSHEKWTGAFCCGSHVSSFAWPFATENMQHRTAKAPVQLELFTPGINRFLLQNQDPSSFRFRRNREKEKLAHFQEKRKGHFLILLTSGNNTLGHVSVSTSPPVKSENLTQSENRGWTLHEKSLSISEMSRSSFRKNRSWTLKSFQISASPSPHFLFLLFSK